MILALPKLYSLFNMADSSLQGTKFVTPENSKEWDKLKGRLKNARQTLTWKLKEELELCNSAKILNPSQPTRQETIKYNALVQSFIVRVPILKSHLDETSEEVLKSFAEECEGKNVKDLSKVEVCMSWIENLLLDCKTTFHSSFDNILGLYLSNGAQTEGLPEFSTLDMSASLAPPPPHPSFLYNNSRGLP